MFQNMHYNIPLTLFLLLLYFAIKKINVNDEVIIYSNPEKYDGIIYLSRKNDID